MAISALTLTLTRIWVDPSTSDCINTLPCSALMNCGSSVGARHAIHIVMPANKEALRIDLQLGCVYVECE